MLAANGLSDVVYLRHGLNVFLQLVIALQACGFYLFVGGGGVYQTETQGATKSRESVKL